MPLYKNGPAKLGDASTTIFSPPHLLVERLVLPNTIVGGCGGLVGGEGLHRMRIGMRSNSIVIIIEQGSGYHHLAVREGGEGRGMTKDNSYQITNGHSFIPPFP